MKKCRKLILIAAVLCIALMCFAACGPKSRTLTYLAQEGGFIAGDSVQTLVEKDEIGNEVMAIAKDGYRFVGWDDGKTEAARIDAASEDKTFTAKFEKAFTLTYAAQEGGEIIGEGTQYLFQDETGGSVTAAAKEGYRFVGWDDGKTEAVRSDAISEDKTFTAKFEKTFALTYAAQEGGEVIGATAQALLPDEMGSRVTAVAGEGYLFVGWDDGKAEAVRSDAISENRTITAKFERALTLTYAAQEGGEIIGERAQTLPQNRTGSEVRAVAGDGYRFLGWDDGKTEAVRSDAITENKTITAKFGKLYSVLFLSDDSAAGSIEGTARQLVVAGEQTASVTAAPALGYRFTGWSNGQTDPTISVQTDADLVLTAHFAIEALSLPIVRIETAKRAPVADKETYVDCAVTVENAETAFEFSDEPGRIKGRGNSTWGMPKKPYKLKFTNKIDLFGNGAAKTWVFLADYTDMSLLRNKLVYTVGAEVFGLEYTTTAQPVELYLNGSYDGVYLVCEQTETGSTRVDIGEDPVEGADQPFLVEMDHRAPNEGRAGYEYVEVYFDEETEEGKTERRAATRPFAIKSPDPDDAASDEVRKSVADKVKAMLDAAWKAVCGTDWAEVDRLLDTDSFAKTYFINELFKNSDVQNSSWYLYHDVGGKIVSGPLWDYDLSVGNMTPVNGQEAFCPPDEDDEGNDVLTGLWNEWYRELMEFSEFRAKVKTLCEEKEQAIRTAIKSVVDEALQNKDSYLRNFARWNILGKYLWGSSETIWSIDTWEGQVGFVTDYLDKSLARFLEIYGTSAG